MKCVQTKELFDLDASLLARTASVVRNRRAILNRLDVETGRFESSDGAFTTAARTFDFYVHLSNAKLRSLFSCLLGRHLSRIRRALSTSLKTTRTSTRPAQRITLRVRDGHGGVIERRVDIHDASRHIAAYSTFFWLNCHEMELQ